MAQAPTPRREHAANTTSTEHKKVGHKPKVRVRLSALLAKGPLSFESLLKALSKVERCSAPWRGSVGSLYLHGTKAILNWVLYRWPSLMLVSPQSSEAEPKAYSRLAVGSWHIIIRSRHCRQNSDACCGETRSEDVHVGLFLVGTDTGRAFDCMLGCISSLPLSKPQTPGLRARWRIRIINAMAAGVASAALIVGL